MSRSAEDVRSLLNPLLPAGATPEAVLPADALARLREHWSRLEALGFELEARPQSLRVGHQNRGFDTVIQLTGPEDLGERRRLFAELKAAFGGFRDKLPWLFQSSPAVTMPYESLRAVTEVCQSVRERARAAAQG